MNNPDRLSKKDDKTPVMIRTVIIVITILALFMAIKTVQRYIDEDNQTASNVVASDKTGGMGEQDDNPADEASYGVSEGEGTPSSAPDLPVQVDELSSDGTPKPDQAYSPTPDKVREARGLSLPRGVARKPDVDDASVYAALLGQVYLEAQTLYLLTADILNEPETQSIAVSLQNFQDRNFDAPYFSELIPAFSKLAARLTCLLLAGMSAKPEAKAMILEIAPDETDRYAIGYPAIMGHYTEIKLKAWSIYLSFQGRKSMALAQRIEGELLSMQSLPRLVRTEKAMEIFRSILPRAGEDTGLQSSSSPGWPRILTAEKDALGAAPSLMHRLWARSRSCTDSVRYLFTGYQP